MPNSQQHILVSGAAGFIGSWITEGLLKEGYGVIGVDNLSGGFIENLPKGNAANNFKFHKIDIAEYDVMDEIFAAHKPHVVYHCAAQAHEGASYMDPYRIVRSNSLISSVIFELAIKHGVGKIVYFSSMARYGKNKVPFTEDMKCRGVDPYGLQKIACEEMLAMLSDVHGIKYTIVVPRNVFGPRQAMDDLYRNFITIVCNRILRGDPIYLYGAGKSIRSFSYIADSLPCFLKVADTEKYNKEIFNIGGTQPVSVLEAAKEIISHFPGCESEIIDLPPRYGEVEVAYASYEKATKILGFEEKVGWQSGIAKTVEWSKQKGRQEWRKYFLPLKTESMPLPWREFSKKS